MNQIVAMFQDSNSRLTKIMEGNYDRGQIEDAYREFSGQIKLVNSVVQAYAVSSKNKRAMAALGRMNLLDDQTAIAIGLPASADYIKCPQQDDVLITREQCLDYSGDTKNGCSNCPNLATTRKLLVDNIDKTYSEE
jgi:hypothetical protein